MLTSCLFLSISCLNGVIINPFTGVQIFSVGRVHGVTYSISLIPMILKRDTALLLIVQYSRLSKNYHVTQNQSTEIITTK